MNLLSNSYISRLGLGQMFYMVMAYVELRKRPEITEVARDAKVHTYRERLGTNRYVRKYLCLYNRSPRWLQSYFLQGARAKPARENYQFSCVRGGVVAMAAAELREYQTERRHLLCGTPLRKCPIIRSYWGVWS